MAGPTTHTVPTQNTMSIKRPMPAKPIIRVAVIIGAIVTLFAASHGARSLAHDAVRGLTPVDVLFFVIGLILFAGSSLILWRGRQAGETLLMLRRSPYTWLYGALAAAFMVICAIRLLNPHLRQPSALFLNLAWIAFCLAHLANRPRVRERGIVNGARLLPWRRIVSYEVSAARPAVSGPSDATLTIEYYASLDPLAAVRSTTIRCSAARRGDIEILLARHVRTEQGHRRWHARRVQVVQQAAPTAQAAQASGPLSAMHGL